MTSKSKTEKNRGRPRGYFPKGWFEQDPRSKKQKERGPTDSRIKEDKK